MQVMIVVRSDLKVTVPGSAPATLSGILFEDDFIRPEWIERILRDTTVEGFSRPAWITLVRSVMSSVSKGTATVYKRSGAVEIIVMHAARGLSDMEPLKLKPVDVPRRYRVHSTSGRSVTDAQWSSKPLDRVRIPAPVPKEIVCSSS